MEQYHPSRTVRRHPDFRGPNRRGACRIAIYLCHRIAIGRLFVKALVVTVSIVGVIINGSNVHQFRPAIKPCASRPVNVRQVARLHLMTG